MSYMFDIFPNILDLRDDYIHGRRGYRKKMNLLKISQFPDFIQCLLDFSQYFPDIIITFPRFFTNKIFQDSQVRTLR